MRTHRRSAVAALSLLALAASTNAAVISVGTGGDCTTSSLAEAIVIADQQSGADEIRITSDIDLSAQQLTISNQSLALRGGWSSCAANAVQNGRSTMVGNGSDSVLTVREDAGNTYTLSLDRIDIRNGGGGTDGVGGGIDVYGHWQMTLRRMDIGQNHAEFDGGGLAIEGADYINPASIDIGEDVLIHDNVAVGGSGGGIYGKRAMIKLRADRVTIRGNRANSGGGIAANNGNVYVGAFGDEIPYTSATGLIVEQNQATDGGGIAMFGSGWLFDAHELVVRNNHASRNGGGIYAIGGQLQLGRDYQNGQSVQCAPGNFCSRIEGNVAGLNCPAGGTNAGYGGGLYLDKVNAYIAQTLISDNCAHKASALFTWGYSTRVENSVVARNLLEYSIYTETVTTGSRNGDPQQSFEARGVSFFDNRGRLPDGSSTLARVFVAAFITTRMVGVAADGPLSTTGADNACLILNAGASAYRNPGSNDFRPAAGSPLIDACAASTFAPSYTGIDLQPRCVDDPNIDQGGSCDIGAVEAPLDPFFAGFGDDFE